MSRSTNNANSYFSKFQQSGGGSQYLPSYDTSKYESAMNNNLSGLQNAYQSANQGYGQAVGNALGNYQNANNDYLKSLRQQTQMQINNLNAQLQANKDKWKLDTDRQSAMVNAQYKQSNDQIDAQTFENLKYANQVGAQRGVSSSAQMMAMDNQVNQQSMGMFQDNLDQRNQALNDLQYKMASGILDLEMNHQTNTTNVLMNQMSKESQAIMNMAQQQLGIETDVAKTQLANLLKMSEQQFNSQMEMEGIKFQSEQQRQQALYDHQMNIVQQNLQLLGAQDDRNFQMNQSDIAWEREKQMEAIRHSNDMAKLAQQQAYSKASSGGGGGSIDPTKHPMFDTALQTHMQQTDDPFLAFQRASADVLSFLETGTTPATQARQHNTAVVKGALSQYDPIQSTLNRGQNILQNYAPKQEAPKLPTTSNAPNNFYRPATQSLPPNLTVQGSHTAQQQSSTPTRTLANVLKNSGLSNAKIQEVDRIMNQTEQTFGTMMGYSDEIILNIVKSVGVTDRELRAIERRLKGGN